MDRHQQRLARPGSTQPASPTGQPAGCRSSGGSEAGSKTPETREDLGREVFATTPDQDLR